MNEVDKRHKINVAYNLIKTTLEDTDEELWSYFFLENALVELDRWFEEAKMRDDFGCPVEDCEDCEFNRTQSWCAQALPDYKGNTELEKIRMEGFWEALDWCEDHYKWMEDHWEQLDAYASLVSKILEDCYNEKRIPTEADMFMIDSFWEDKET